MSIRARCHIGLALSVLVAHTSLGQALQDSPIIFRSGQWDVHRTTDMMSDKTVCTATYNRQFGIMLGEYSMTIAVADGVKRVRLRFDDEAAGPERPASASEVRNNRIEIGGSDFAEMLRSRRLRFEAVTQLNTTFDGDIDLSGAFQAHDNVAAGCAGNPIVMPNPPAPPQDNCTPQLRQRMTDQGIPAANIDKICRG